MLLLLATAAVFSAFSTSTSWSRIRASRHSFSRSNVSVLGSFSGIGSTARVASDAPSPGVPALAVSAASELTILFVLIGRDVADELPYVLRNIERLHLAARLRRGHVLLIENDSTDSTAHVFTAWANASRQAANLTGEVRSFTWNTGKKDLNILARARDVYLQAVRNQEYEWAELLVPIDTDMCYPWDVTAMAAVLHELSAHTAAWDAAFANGVCGWYLEPANSTVGVETVRNSAHPEVRPVYCDHFAFIDANRSKHHGFDVLLRPHTACNEPAPPRAWEPTCSHLSPSLSIIPVLSAFGGMGVYRIEALRSRPQCTHMSSHQFSNGCEHVNLNLCLADAGARLIIVPRLVVNWYESAIRGRTHRLAALTHFASCREGCVGPVRDDDPGNYGRTGDPPPPE